MGKAHTEESRMSFYYINIKRDVYVYIYVFVMVTFL